MSISTFLFERFAGLLFDRHTDPNDHYRNVLFLGGGIRGSFFHSVFRLKTKHTVNQISMKIVNYVSGPQDGGLIRQEFSTWWVDAMSCKKRVCANWFGSKDLHVCEGGGCTMEEGTYAWYKDKWASPENQFGEWLKFDVKSTDDGATCQRSLITNEKGEKTYIPLGQPWLVEHPYQLVSWTHPKPPKSLESSCPDSWWGN